jgi:hypothetical protein
VRAALFVKNLANNLYRTVIEKLSQATIPYYKFGQSLLPRSIYPFIDRLRITTDLKTSLKLNNRSTINVGVKAPVLLASTSSDVVKNVVKAKMERYKKQAKGSSPNLLLAVQ